MDIQDLTKRAHHLTSGAQQVRKSVDLLGHQLTDQVRELARTARPYGRQAFSTLEHAFRDLRPYGDRALSFARSNPGKTVAGAFVIGWLLSRRGR